MMKQFSAALDARFIALAGIATATLMLTACGQSGNLVLPQKSSQDQTPPGYVAPATQPAP